MEYKNNCFLFSPIGNGVIDFEEFCVMMALRLRADDEDDSYMEAFRVFDKVIAVTL